MFVLQRLGIDEAVQKLNVIHVAGTKGKVRGLDAPASLGSACMFTNGTGAVFAIQLAADAQLESPCIELVNCCHNDGSLGHP